MPQLGGASKRRRRRRRPRASPRPLTAEAKWKIARLRQTAKAKLAELEILHGKNVAGAAGDPEKLAEVEEHYRIDRGRVESQLDSDIAAVRREG